MKEAGALALIGKTKPVASLAEGVATRIPGSGGMGNVAFPRKLNKARVGAAALAGAAAVGGATALATSGKDREKRAAIDMLIEAGIDFDTAVNLVEKKAAELA